MPDSPDTATPVASHVPPITVEQLRAGNAELRQSVAGLMRMIREALELSTKPDPDPAEREYVRYALAVAQDRGDELLLRLEHDRELIDRDGWWRS